MSITLEFLGTDRPALPMVAEYLLNRYRRGAQVDLRGVIVVVPGSRAGRRLLELLVDACEDSERMLTPPVIETVGKLPEQLYRPQRPFASDLTQRLTWSASLRAATAAQLVPVVPRPPAAGDLSQWLALGDLLRRQHLELAADGLDFGDVARLGRQLADFGESARWQALHQLQQDYLRRLDALELWDRQTARLVAIDKRECSVERDIVLVGTADMNVTLRQMLDQVADHVTSLVFAPAAWADRFDAHGCLIPERWLAAELPIATEQVLLAEGPREQAAAALQCLAGWQKEYHTDEIVIGVPDEQLIPDLQRVLSGAGWRSRWGPGTPVTESPPVQMLRAVARFVEQSQFADFAALLRHTDVGNWLERMDVPPCLLEELDAYQNEHLPHRVPEQWLGDGRQFTALQQAWRQLSPLLLPLQRSPQRLTEWSQPLLDVLFAVYGERDFDRHDDTDSLILAGCDAIRTGLAEWAAVPAGLIPETSASEAVRWLLDDLQHLAVPARPDPDAIELLGWLELPLDDAPALVVASFSEGQVPAAVNSDLFLPNALRQRLGILDNDRRYARDAYAVSVLAASRAALHWIVARRSREGDPLAPSRLLFATDSTTAAERALQFFRPPATLPRQADALRSAVPEGKGLRVPRPRPLAAPIRQVSVTSFRDYLACPYRFYLRHVLRLEAIDDSARELDGGGFGSLAHEVLRSFGAGDCRDSTDQDEIAAFLEQQLDECVRRALGGEPHPAVRVQVEQLRLRLRAFAEQQAGWARQGWRIEWTEVPTPDQPAAEFTVDGQPILLRGRMDRVDLHAETGRRVIWDYKTSDAGLLPDATHRRRKEWVDLQLPLYRHLAAAIGIEGPVEMGYILLPKDTSATKLCRAEWNAEELALADETARQVVRGIRKEVFWPPAPIPPAFSEAFAPLCQDEVLDRAEN